jgi:hypothetical protein
VAGSALPELSMYWTNAPNIQPLPHPSSGSPGAAAPIRNAPVSLNFQELRGAEQTLITSSSAIVTAYETLKALYLADKDTVYGQSATVDGTVTGPPANSGSGQGTPEAAVVNDPIQQSALTFANGDGTAQNPGINAVQESVLLGIANSMAIVGEFIAAMNMAAESYCNADFSSILPGPT